MIFKPYYYFETGCAAYLFGCGGLGKCTVVDAHEEDVDAYAAFAASKDMRITHVIDTHVHADHRSGGPALAEKVGASYCLHESADVALAFEPLKDGQDELEVYPGHFSGSVCGAGMSGKPSSTIAFEKRWNPLLSKPREELIDARCDVPPKPAEMAQILRINQGREGNTP